MSILQILSHQPTADNSGQMQHHQYERPPSSFSPSSPPPPSLPFPYPSTDATAMPQSAFGNQPFFPVQQSPFHSTTRQPMQSNVSNQRQLPDYWTPFTCCGASNGTWALVIMLVILVDCSVLFIRSMQDVVNESGNVSVVNGITGGLALIHALTSLVALIQISEGKTTGLSTLLTLLFVDYFISGCVILMSIIASCIYGDALSSPSTSVSDKNGKENTIGLTQAIFIAIVYLILLPLIKFSRKVLIDYRKEMRMVYTHNN